MKSISIMQPYFYPYLGYFQLINKVDMFLPYGHVDFNKRSYITRNSLVTSSKESLPIRIETRKSSFPSKIKDIRILDNNFQRVLVKKIKNTYSRSPYFEEVFNSMEPFFNYQTDSLMNYNSVTLKGTCRTLGIENKFLNWRQFDERFMEIEEDLLKFKRCEEIKMSTRRVFELCKFLDAKKYINPEGGVRIYSTKTFFENNISLFFHQSNVSTHRSQGDGKLQYASIVDVLMVNGISETKKMLNMGHLF